MSSIVSLTVSQNLIRNLEKGYMQFPRLSATDIPRRWCSGRRRRNHLKPIRTRAIHFFRLGSLFSANKKEMTRGFSIVAERNVIREKNHWQKNEVAAADVQRCPNGHRRAHCSGKRLTAAAINENP